MQRSSIANKLRKILPSYKKPIVCEHGRIDYKTLSKLATKQMKVIDVLAQQLLIIEKEKEVIRNAACKELDKLKEAGQVKEYEIENLSRQVDTLVRRLEVNKDAH